MNELPEGFRRDDLMEGEEILWTGQPSGPFVSVYLGSCLVQFSFVLVPLYIWGRFDDLERFFPVLLVFALVNAVLYSCGRRRMGRTHYLLTNERVIVVTGAAGRTIRAEFVSGLPGLSKRASLGGTMTISFAAESGWISVFKSTDALAFSDIRDADRVYDMITSMRKAELASPG